MKISTGAYEAGPKFSLFRVMYSKPGRGGYRNNGDLRIVAASAIEASKACQKLHPDCRIWNVIHCGQVEYLSDDVLKIIEETGHD